MSWRLSARGLTGNCCWWTDSTPGSSRWRSATCCSHTSRSRWPMAACTGSVGANRWTAHAINPQWRSRAPPTPNCGSGRKGTAPGTPGASLFGDEGLLRTGRQGLRTTVQRRESSGHRRSGLCDARRALGIWISHRRGGGLRSARRRRHLGGKCGVRHCLRCAHPSPTGEPCLREGDRVSLHPHWRPLDPGSSV